jgi:hypothetical protein
MQEGTAPKVSEQRLAKVTIYLSGDQTPELTPMWDAFDAFALRFPGRGTGYPEAAGELEQSGVSRAGIETILAIVHQHLRQRDALAEELGPKQRAFVEILGRARTTLGKRFEPRRPGDVKTLAGIAGRSENEVAELMAAWERDPGVDVSLDSIRQLKLELSREDWDRFRAFLLHEVAPVMSYSAFREEG